MPLYDSSKNPAVIEARVLLAELFNIIKKDDSDDRIITIREKFADMAKSAIKYDDAELLAAIIYFEMEFLNFTFSENKQAKIALFFELDHNAVLELAKMYTRRQEFFFIPFLYNHNTISIYGKNVIAVKTATVKLRLEVYKQLQAHSVPGKFPLISSSSDIEAILTMLEGVLKSGNTFEVKYLSNLITYVIEDALVQNEVRGIAYLLRGYVDLLGTMHDKEQHAILFSAIGLDAGNLPNGIKLLNKKYRSALMWMIVNSNSVIGKIAQANGMSYKDLLLFKDSLSEEICRVIGAKTLLRDFRELLIESISGVEQAKQVMPEHELLFTELESHLYNSVQHLNSELFAAQVNLVIQAGVKYYHQGYITELCQIFELNSQELDRNIKLLAADELGQLAWHYINRTLDICAVAEINNIPFEQYIAFKKAAYAQLSSILGKPVLQEPEVLAKQLLVAIGQAATVEDFHLILHSGAILLREAYLQKNSVVFARLIDVVMDVVKQLYASSANNITALIYILKSTQVQTIELHNALITNDEQALFKVLVDISLMHCNFYKDGVVSEHLLSPEVQVMHEMSLSCWKAQKKRDKYYLLELQSFQAAIYAAGKLPDKTEKLGAIVQCDYIWDWDKVPSLQYIKETGSFCLLGNSTDKISIAIDNYYEETAKILASNDFVALDRQRILRRHLLDIAVFNKDHSLFVKIISHDLDFLLLANTQNYIAQVQVLLNLSISKLQLYIKLLSDNATLPELYWHLVGAPDLTYSSIYSFSVEEAFVFRGKVWETLIKERYELFTDKQILQGFAESLTNIHAWPLCAKRIIAFMQSLALQSIQQSHSEVTRTFTGFVFDFINTAMQAYEGGEKKVIVLLYDLMDIELKEINALIAVKNSKLLAWHILNSSKVWAKFYYDNSIPITQVNLWKKAVIDELKLLYKIPVTDEFLRQTKDFTGSDFATSDFTKLRLLQMEIVASLISRIQNIDIDGFAQTIIDAVRMVASSRKDFQITLQYLLGVSGDLTLEYNYCLANNNYGLLVRLLYQAILKEYYYMLMISELDNKALLEFSAAVFQKMENILSVPLLLRPEDAAMEYKKLLLTTAQLLQEPRLMERLHMLQVEIQRAILDAYEFDNAKLYASWIKLQAEFATRAYQAGQQTVLFKILGLKHEDVGNVIGFLKAGHAKALQRWLINHNIVYGSSNPWNLILKHKDAYMGRVFTKFTLEPKFTEAVYQALGIEPIDAWTMQDDAEPMDSQTILSSIRRLANQGINLKCYEEKLSNLGKHGFHELLQLKDNIPSDADTRQYHEIYQILEAVWHSHIIGHIVSVLTPTVHFGRFELRWEGSFGNSMVKIMQQSHAQYAALPEFQEETIRLCKSIFPAITPEAIQQFITSLSIEINNIFIWTNAKEIEDKLNERLRDGRLIAIPVRLVFYEEGGPGRAGHAVGALFCGDIAVFSDRGGDSAEVFTGVSFYRIGCTQDKKEEVIRALVNSNKLAIRNTDYPKLQKELQLTLLHRVPMLQQLRGNCGHASCAELLHLCITIFEVINLAMAQQRCAFSEELLKHSCLLGQQIHTLVMRAQQERAVDDLIALLQAPNCVIEPPREFFAHVYMTTKYRLGHNSIAKKLEDGRYFSEGDRRQAYMECIRYASLLLLEEVPKENRAVVQLTLLGALAVDVVNTYFSKCDTRQLAAVLENSITCIIHGLTSKQAQSFCAVRKPLSLTDTQQQLALFTSVSASRVLLQDVMTAAFRERLINEIVWQQMPNGCLFPITLNLNVSAEEFWQFVVRKLQESRDLETKGYLALLSSSASSTTPMLLAYSASMRQAMVVEVDAFRLSRGGIRVRKIIP